MAVVALLQPPAVARLVIQDNALKALDESDAVLWSYAPGGFLEMKNYSNPANQLALLADLDGDGRQDVLFGVSQADPYSVPSSFFRLDQGGSVVWRMHAGRSIPWDGGMLDDAFEANEIVLPRARPGESRVHLQISRSRDSSPTQVRAVAPEGEVLGEWWNHGHFGHHVTWDMDGDGREEVILGGIHNDHGATPVMMPALAVLDPLDLEGAAPAPPGSQSRFTDLSAGSQLAYILFPRNEIYRESGKGLGVDRIEIVNGEKLRVIVGGQLCEVHYEFDRHLALIGKYSSDQCLGAHVDLEREGRLDHAYRRDDPGLTPLPLYFDGKGWTTLSAWSRALHATSSGPRP